jgi:hypothetical protein
MPDKKLSRFLKKGIHANFSNAHPCLVQSLPLRVASSKHGDAGSERETETDSFFAKFMNGLIVAAQGRESWECFGYISWG